MCFWVFVRAHCILTCFLLVWDYVCCGFWHIFGSSALSIHQWKLAGSGLCYNLLLNFGREKIKYVLWPVKRMAIVKSYQISSYFHIIIYRGHRFTCRGFYRVQRFIFVKLVRSIRYGLETNHFKRVAKLDHHMVF